MQQSPSSSAWRKFDHLRIREAAERIRGVVRHTPLSPFALDDERIELRLKLENRQETGSFKARGAWNQLSQLSPQERSAGVVAASSGNHGRAVSWAAQRAGVAATIVMPENSYPNKIRACRELGAEVVLTPTREGADVECAARVTAGRVLIHPYAAERTLQGAGTVGLEIAQDWPEVELVVFPVGGGGLLSGSSLALRQSLGEDVCILGAEPTGAPSMTLGLEAGEPVDVGEITTVVQGLCPINSGAINIEICSAAVNGVQLLDDDEIHAAQRRLVRAGEIVEPAGAAASALVFRAELGSLLEGRDARDPLRVAAVVSGGNPDSAQLERLRHSS